MAAVVLPPSLQDGRRAAFEVRGRPRELEALEALEALSEAMAVELYTLRSQ